jgi:hypothetical protein
MPKKKYSTVFYTGILNQGLSKFLFVLDPKKKIEHHSTRREEIPRTMVVSQMTLRGWHKPGILESI